VLHQLATHPPLLLPPPLRLSPALPPGGRRQHVRGTEAVSIVEISQELDQPGIKGLVAFLGPLILDSIFEKIMPGVFHPNLLIYCREDGVTFTDARKRKSRDLKLQLSFIGAQFLWGSSAAKLYAGERLSVPLLAAAGALAGLRMMRALWCVRWLQEHV